MPIKKFSRSNSRVVLLVRIRVKANKNKIITHKHMDNADIYFDCYKAGAGQLKLLRDNLFNPKLRLPEVTECEPLKSTPN